MSEQRGRNNTGCAAACRFLFLAKNEKDSLAWRKNFVQAFLERDIPQFGIGIASPALLRFWAMLAHYAGQIWNSAEPARSLGISETSVRRYLDIMEGVFMVRQLKPWHENLKEASGQIA